MFNFKLSEDDHEWLGIEMCQINPAGDLNFLDFANVIFNTYGVMIEYKLLPGDDKCVTRLKIVCGEQVYIRYASEMPCILGFDIKSKCINIFRLEDAIKLSNDYLTLCSSKLLHFITRFINQFTNDNYSISKIVITVDSEESNFGNIFKDSMNINYITDVYSKPTRKVMFMTYRSIPIIIFHNIDCGDTSPYIEVYGSKGEKWLDMNRYLG